MNVINYNDLNSKEYEVDLNNTDIVVDDIIFSMMDSVLKICKKIDAYLKCKTLNSEDGKNYYNMQNVIDYQDELNKY